MPTPSFGQSNPTPCAVLPDKQERLSQCLKEEEESYVIDGIDSSIQQWISVDNDSAKWNYLASPMTPKEFSRIPVRPLSALQETTSQETLTKDDHQVDQVDQVDEEEETKKVESAPGTPTRRLSSFLRHELSHFDNHSAGQLQLSTVESSPLALYTEKAEEPKLAEPTAPTSPAPSCDTFGSVGFSSLATTTSTDYFSAASSSSSCISAQITEPTEECEEPLVAASKTSPKIDTAINPPRPTPKIDTEMKWPISSTEPQMFETPVLTSPESSWSSFDNSPATVKPSGGPLKLVTDLPEQQQQVKYGHGVVWVGEAVHSYYLTTPIEQEPQIMFPVPRTISAAQPVLQRVQEEPHLPQLRVPRVPRVTPPPPNIVRPHAPTLQKKQSSLKPTLKSLKSFTSLRSKQSVLRHNDSSQDKKNHDINESKHSHAHSFPAPSSSSCASKSYPTSSKCNNNNNNNNTNNTNNYFTKKSNNKMNSIDECLPPVVSRPECQTHTASSSLLSRVCFDFEDDEDDDNLYQNAAGGSSSSSGVRRRSTKGGGVSLSLSKKPAADLYSGRPNQSTMEYHELRPRMARITGRRMS